MYQNHLELKEVCIITYIQSSYIQTYKHTYIIRTYIHTCIHTYILVYTYTDHSKLKLCLVSSIDESEISQALSCHEWEVRHVDGCGYRLLCVVDGCADVFVLTKSSCYKWDTCGAQAILKALGGNIIRWDLLFEQDKKVPLIYNQSDNPSLEGARKWSNEGGIVGFVSADVVHSLYTKFRH